MGQLSKAKDVSVRLLHDCFAVDFDTGLLTWKARPREHFSSQTGQAIFNALFAGKLAGCMARDNRPRVRLTIRGDSILLFEHRVVWALATGTWPNEEIDHINGDQADNRLSNLRAATRGQNAQNLKVRKSGIVGVSWDKERRKWHAYINVNKHRTYLGRFSNRDDARAAYLAAKMRLHSFQPTSRTENGK